MEQFTSAETENLRKVFQSVDQEGTGQVDKQTVESIIMELSTSKDVDAESINILLNDFATITADYFTFEEFLELVEKLEQSDLVHLTPMADNESLEITNTEKLLDVLRVLENYRKECEEQGRYAEADKARSKHEKLKKNEIIRQLRAIRAAQEEDLRRLDESHQTQFAEFTKAWDDYMAEYENTAYSSLEKLKEKHMLDFQEFHNKILKETRLKVKPSKELLALRQKEQALAKQKRYPDAEKVKETADKLEELERARAEALVQQTVVVKEKKIKKEQQQALAALMRRIQRDRDEQIKHRKEDSLRLIQRNKNIRNDLIAKQNLDAKRLIEEIKRTFGLNNYDIKYQTKTGGFRLERASQSRIDEL